MRKMVLVCVALLLVAGTAFAGQNPNLLIGLDSTDPPTGANRIDNPAGPFNVYVVFMQFGNGGGMLGAAFKFDRTFSGYKLETVNLLGGLSVGDPESGYGWALATAGDCAMPVGGVVVAARLQYLYDGVTPGTITLLPHDTDGAVAADCNNDLDVWTVYSNFGVNADAPEAPVEAASWTAIKALYR